MVLEEAVAHLVLLLGKSMMSVVFRERKRSAVLG